MTALQFSAAILFFSRFVLAAIAITLCLVMFRRSRLVGWKLLAIPYFQPFVAVLIRLWQGKPVLTYETIGQAADGAMKTDYRLEFPAFYILTVMALLALVLEVRRDVK